MEDVLIPLIVVPILFIGLPWLIFHYITKWKTAATLTRATRNCSTSCTTPRAGSTIGCARSSGS